MAYLYVFLCFLLVLRVNDLLGWSRLFYGGGSDVFNCIGWGNVECGVLYLLVEIRLSDLQRLFSLDVESVDVLA